MMNLSDVFASVAYKELAAVDIPHYINNQHELNGVAALREFFGTSQKSQGAIMWHYFADDEEPRAEAGEWTFYDARENHPSRTEWRFYFTGNFLSTAAPGDELVLARTPEGTLYGLAFRAGSAWQRAARVLFDFQSATAQAQTIPTAQLDAKELEFTRRQILDELGFEAIVPPASDDTQLVLQQFGEGAFPKTKVMSAFARSIVDADPMMQPDETLQAWIEREEALFRALERVEVQKRLDAGFETVENFISYSLSVQNRRKSRMGHALQNHLAALFDAHALLYNSQAKTERNNTPDFLFPSGVEYQDATFDASLLVMLGAKSTCKDRWRQVLTEADRIPQKHLCTLEAAISKEQTDEMKQRNLTLVLPERLHITYSPSQRAELLTLTQFIEEVKIKQAT